LSRCDRIRLTMHIKCNLNTIVGIDENARDSSFYFQDTLK